MGSVSLTILIALSAILHIRAEYAKKLSLVYVFKPLTTCLIIVLCVLQTPEISPAYKYLILCGLACSLVGDVFLMLPSDQFIAGLVSFLFAHVFYIIAFTRDAGFHITYVFVGLIGLLGGIVLVTVLAHTGRLTGPVIVYTGVILVMLWQALERWYAAATPSALLAVIGACLFVFSDFILAYNKFVRQFKSARLLNLSTYFAAQWCIALSVRLFA